jgi:molybdopterin-containing oxidoreductase family iron-sulfur binding subunit
MKESNESMSEPALGKNMDRKAFLKISGALAVGALLATAPNLLLLAAEDKKTVSGEVRRWGMVVDLDKCNGCKVCETTCRIENNVPYFNQPRYDAYWLRIAEIEPETPGLEKVGKRPVPLMCQHCEDAPCIHVCVTKASFRRDDGIVLVDEHRCIGCRYCVIACPYRARSIIFRENDTWTNKEVPKIMIVVSTKCNFCVHRVDQGKQPACVEGCPKNALIFGDMMDPKSEIGRLIAESHPQVLRPEKMVKPGVFYKGL